MYNNFIRGSPGGAIGAFPDNPTSSDFEEKVIPKDNYGMMILSFLILMIHMLFIFVYYCIKREKLSRKDSIYLIFSFVYIVLSIPCIIFVTYPSKDYYICKYPFNCEKGDNDTIVTSNYYYALPENENNNCPSIEKMINVYLMKKEIKDINCDTNIHGCCDFSERCYIYSEYDYPYSIYKYDKENHIDDNKITYDQKKIDLTGSTCSIKNDRKSIEKLINVYLNTLFQKAEDNFVNYFIFYLCFYICSLILIAKKYKTDTDYEKMSGSV